MRSHDNSALKVGLAATVFAVMATGPAFAHPGHDVSGLTAGFTHPLSGLDHLAVIVAMGWAGLLRAQGRLRLESFALPGAFLGAMIAGALGGAALAPGVVAEAGVGLSLGLAGLLVVLGARAPAALVYAIGAVCGLAHGSVHAIELSGLAQHEFIFGMAGASALLLAGGYAMGLAFSRFTPSAHVAARLAAATGLTAMMMAAAPLATLAAAS